MNNHTLDIRRHPFGWYALCTACPDWQGQPEQQRPEAIRHHTIHTFQLAGGTR